MKQHRWTYNAVTATLFLLVAATVAEEELSKVNVCSTELSHESDCIACSRVLSWSFKHNGQLDHYSIKHATNQ